MRVRVDPARRGWWSGWWSRSWSGRRLEDDRPDDDRPDGEQPAGEQPDGEPARRRPPAFRAAGAAVGILLGFGAALEVLGPPEVRELMAERAGRVVGVYS